MRRGAIIGVGNTRFRARRIEKTYLELARDAAYGHGRRVAGMMCRVYCGNGFTGWR